jgi:Type II secretion system (T2SS), protein F
MTPLSAAGAWPMLVLALALLVWSPRDVLAGRRARALRRADGREPPVPNTIPAERPPPAWRRWAIAGAAGLAVGLLMGGPVGAGAAVGVALGGERLLRNHDPRDEQAMRTALLSDLPGACDLLGVCLTAGMPVGGALVAVGEATGGPLGSQLRGVAALYRLGAEPRRAWADVPVELAALGRVLVRAGESGASVVPALQALAADSRAGARAAAEAGVQRAGVWVLAPLGACFLPAFLCLGVVPLVLGIARDVFG